MRWLFLIAALLLARPARADELVPVPELTVELDGTKLSLASAIARVAGTRGTVVMVWGNWCGKTCEKLATRWSDNLAGSGVALVVVDFHSNAAQRAREAEAIGQLGLHAIVMWVDDTTADLEPLMKAVGDELPSTLVLRGDGQVSAIARGSVDADLETAVAGLVADPLAVELSVIDGSLHGKKKRATLSELTRLSDRKARLAVAVTWTPDGGARGDAAVRRWDAAGKKLAKKGLRVVAVDVSPSPLDAADRKAMRKRFARLGVKMPLVHVDEPIELGFSSRPGQSDAPQILVFNDRDFTVASDHRTAALAALEAFDADHRALVSAIWEVLEPVEIDASFLPRRLIEVGHGEIDLVARARRRDADRILILGADACADRCATELAKYEALPGVLVVAWVRQGSPLATSWNDLGLSFPVVVDDSDRPDTLEWQDTRRSYVLDAEGAITWTGDELPPP